MNGIGERTGNANLMTIIPTLQLKMGMTGVGEHLTNLTALSRFTDEQARYIYLFAAIKRTVVCFCLVRQRFISRTHNVLPTGKSAVCPWLVLWASVQSILFYWSAHVRIPR